MSISDDEVEAALKAAPKFWRETSEADKAMRKVLSAAAKVRATPPAGGDEPVAWRQMKDAPFGSPIVIKQRQWIATVILNPPSEEGHWTDGDSVIHYNGNVLVSGFHGTYDGWLPAGSAPPTPTPVSAEVTIDHEAFVTWLRQWVKGRFGVWITHNTAKDARTALLAALSPSMGRSE